MHILKFFSFIIQQLSARRQEYLPEGRSRSRWVEASCLPPPAPPPQTRNTAAEGGKERLSGGVEEEEEEDVMEEEIKE